MTRATVIIPTFGDAKFAQWAIKSVREQTIKDIEICIICDGSPEHMVTFFEEIAKEDSRIKVFLFPKSPRTGEPYRDIVIKQTTGKIICYCGHDDLWLPNHIEEMEKSLTKNDFTHSLQAFMKMPKDIKYKNDLFNGISYFNLKKSKDKQRALNWKKGESLFGLTYGAHTRKSYLELEEGWVTTPPEMPTDVYMWKKFIIITQNKCDSVKKITALNFPQIPRADWSESERNKELKYYFEQIQDEAFLGKLKLMYYSFPIYQTKHLYKKLKEYLRKHKIIPSKNQKILPN